MTNGTERFLCNRCILPSTFPGISFDDEGICTSKANLVRAMHTASTTQPDNDTFSPEALLAAQQLTDILATTKRTRQMIGWTAH